MEFHRPHPSTWKYERMPNRDDLDTYVEKIERKTNRNMPVEWRGIALYLYTRDR